MPAIGMSHWSASAIRVCSASYAGFGTPVCWCGASPWRGPAGRTERGRSRRRAWAIAGGGSERRGTRASAAESVCVRSHGSNDFRARWKHAGPRAYASRTARGPTGRRPVPRRDRPPIPILPARGPTLQPRVSLRGRRDARPHPRHLLRHPELHRAALPGAAELDGADPGARAVRAGGQAHARAGTRTAAATSSCSTRPPTWTQRPDAVHQARHRPARATRSRSRTTASSTSTASPLDEPYTYTNAAGVNEPTDGLARPGTLGRAGGPAVRDGRPSPEVGGLARLRPDQRSPTSSAARSCATGRSPPSASSRPRRTPTSSRRAP